LYILAFTVELPDLELVSDSQIIGDGRVRETGAVVELVRIEVSRQVCAVCSSLDRVWGARCTVHDE
jgi:hypothetical protein